MNIVQLLGRLTKNPEVKETKNGKLVMTIRLAYDTRRQSDSSGSHSNYIQVEAWEKLAETYVTKLTKGMQVTVKGELVISRWQDGEGNLRSMPKLVASSLVISDLKRRPVEAAAA